MHAVPLIRRYLIAAAVMAVAIGVEPAGSMQDIAPARTHAAAAATYRFQKPPVVLFARLPGPVFHVVFRLDHKLVRNHLGVRATVSLNRTGDPSRPTNFHQPRACYLQELEVGPDDAVLEHPRTGAKVTVTLRVKAPVAQTLTADVRLRRVSAHTFDAPDGDGDVRARGVLRRRCAGCACEGSTGGCFQRSSQHDRRTYPIGVLDASSTRTRHPCADGRNVPSP